MEGEKMSSSHEAGNISVTFKSDEPGGKFNDPKSPGTWVVVHGTVAQVREQIIEIFELDSKTSFDTPLYALVNEATKLFKAVSNVGQILGGTVLSSGGTESAPIPPSGGGDVWLQVSSAKAAASQQEEPPADPILTAVAAAKEITELQQIWAENQSLFTEGSEYMAAYKARGKELSK